MFEPAKLVERFESGELTSHELLIRLCQVAADRAPADLASELPADVLNDLRKWVTAQQESLDRSRVFHAGSFIGEAGYWEEVFRRQSQQVSDGLSRWHPYFSDV